MVCVTAAASVTEMNQPSLGVDFSNEYVAEMVAAGLSQEEVQRRITERDSELPDEVSLSYRLFAFDLETGKQIWDRELRNGPPPVGRMISLACHRSTPADAQTSRQTRAPEGSVRPGPGRRVAADQRGRPRSTVSPVTSSNTVLRPSLAKARIAPAPCSSVFCT